MWGISAKFSYEFPTWTPIVEYHSSTKTTGVLRHSKIPQQYKTLQNTTRILRHCRLDIIEYLTSVKRLLNTTSVLRNCLILHMLWSILRSKQDELGKEDLFGKNKQTLSESYKLTNTIVIIITKICKFLN